MSLERAGRASARQRVRSKSKGGDGFGATRSGLGPVSAQGERQKFGSVVGRGCRSSQRRISKDRREHGFTIIEMMITVAIIITIAAIAVPNLLSAINDARNAKAVKDKKTDLSIVR